jgi:hypothetical protein
MRVDRPLGAFGGVEGLQERQPYLRVFYHCQVHARPSGVGDFMLALDDEP